MLRSQTPARRQLDTPGAASYLGVSPSTLEHWRGRGTGPAFLKIGHQVRYEPADLDAFVAARRVAVAGLESDGVIARRDLVAAIELGLVRVVDHRTGLRIPAEGIELWLAEHRAELERREA